MERQKAEAIERRQRLQQEGAFRKFGPGQDRLYKRMQEAAQRREEEDKRLEQMRLNQIKKDHVPIRMTEIINHSLEVERTIAEA